jgi:glutathione S-transferase
MPFEVIPFPESEEEIKELLKTGTNLFNNIGCPFGHRALWTAIETNSPFRMIDVSLSEMPSSYGQFVNRYETVPCLYDQGLGVFESAIVAEYLDSKYGNGNLFCRDDPAKASLLRLVASKFEMGSLYGLLRNKDSEKNSEFESEIQYMLTELETIYRVNASSYRESGPYLLGSQFSAAEIMVMPFFYRFKTILKHYRGFDLLPQEKYPLLTAAFEASIDRPAFKESSKDANYFIQVYASYAN